MAGKMRVKPALPLWQRLRRRWRAWRSAGLAKSHVVHFVRIGEAQFKRVRFAEAHTAQAIAGALERLADLNCFPELLLRHAEQIWVDYVPGAPPRLNDPADQERLTEFFVRLYGQPGIVASDPAPLTACMLRDLEFLCRAGVLMRDRARELQELEQELRPARVWLGYDYVDPLAKNFIIRDGRAVAIDIEALAAATPLGTGLAKAWLRWPSDPSAEVVRRLLDSGGAELSGQLQWTRLGFVCDYFKQKLLQGKPGYIRVEAFDRLLQSRKAETPP